MPAKDHEVESVEQPVDLGNLIVGEPDLGGAEVLEQSFGLATARDGDDKGFFSSIQERETCAGVAACSSASSRTNRMMGSARLSPSSVYCGMPSR